MRAAILSVCLATAVVWTLAGPGRSASSLMFGAEAGSDDLFLTSHSCFACHNGLVTSGGEDVSIGFSWRSSMMANSARDPYWHAAVRREVMDHPESQEVIEDECSKCHMPMARYEAHEAGEMGRVFDHLPIGAHNEHRDLLAADGVSCSLCHQITDEGLGTEASLVGGFVVDVPTGDGDRPVYGPFDIEDTRIRLMRSTTGFTQTEATHIRESEFCATCHTLITEALGANGEVIGELPEQVPYQEWLHSDYVETASCQDCHMPVVEEEMPITSVLGEPREGLARHTFRGANFLMLQMFQKYRNQLGVEATSQELQLAVTQTRQKLAEESARLSIDSLARTGGRLEAVVSVESLVGHKLPTAYPSRRAWVEFTVRDGDGSVVFSSGAIEPTGAIRGNDNDEDPRAWEPHYQQITSPDQVQIYESILTDAAGEVTTGLLRGLTYAKDNRIPPLGFDKATAEERVAVHGEAANDADFTGGSDSLRYSVELGGATGPLEVEAVLWYQPVGYRWADNLRAYDAPEPEKFVGYYTEMAPASATVLARASADLR